MARRRVTVQVEGAGGLQDAVQLHQAWGHHSQVGRNVVAAQALHHRLQHPRHLLMWPGHHLLVGAGGNVSAASRKAGITRAALHRIMKRLGLADDAVESEDAGREPGDTANEA